MKGEKGRRQLFTCRNMIRTTPPERHPKSMTKRREPLRFDRHLASCRPFDMDVPPWDSISRLLLNWPLGTSLGNLILLTRLPGVPLLNARTWEVMAFFLNLKTPCYGNPHINPNRDGTWPFLGLIPVASVAEPEAWPRVQHPVPYWYGTESARLLFNRSTSSCNS